jgi:cytochrome bd-type quinol oxidase subunit 1
VGFILVYGILGAAGFYLMYQKAVKGPDLETQEKDSDGSSADAQPA